MAKLLQIGHVTAAELGPGHRYGHIACTLGGVNFESTPHTITGRSGIVRGSSARGATHRLFKRQFHVVLTEEQAKRAKKYADSCVGNAYKLGMVPSDTKGGDCSGLISGIICVAFDRPRKRLFSTATWQAIFDDLGFKKGMGGGVAMKVHGIGAADRPFWGFVLRNPRNNSEHVRWVQARLNLAANNKHAVLGNRKLDEDADFGDDTEKVVEKFQAKHGLERDGEVGRNTWRKLNAVR